MLKLFFPCLIMSFPFLPVYLWYLLHRFSIVICTIALLCICSKVSSTWFVFWFYVSWCLLLSFWGYIFLICLSCDFSLLQFPSEITELLVTSCGHRTHWPVGLLPDLPHWYTKVQSARSSLLSCCKSGFADVGPFWL